jgi:hypothetical protein
LPPRPRRFFPKEALLLLQALEEVEERARLFAEECDSLEGFQLLCNDSDHWSGFSASTADILHDEYPKKPLLLFATRSPNLQSHAALTQAVAMARWGPSCTLRVPLFAPCPQSALCYDPTNRFHASAVMAAAIDTCTLPFRILPASSAQPSLSLASLCETLRLPAANVAAVGTIFPASSIEFQDTSQADARLSARERRLKSLPQGVEAHVPADLVQEDLTWLTTGWNPLNGVHCF